jgi:hypothetical protein
MILVEKKLTCSAVGSRESRKALANIVVSVNLTNSTVQTWVCTAWIGGYLDLAVCARPRTWTSALVAVIGQCLTSTAIQAGAVGTTANI